MTAFNSTWPCPPKDLVLSSSDVHVFCATLNLPETVTRQLAQTLSTDEQIRSERFYFERDRRRFIISRGILRTILGCYLGIAADQLQFCYGQHGKPELALGGYGLRFNLSHSQELVLYAVTRDRAIGIDVEYIRPVAEVEQIAQRFFSAREKAVFCTLPDDCKQAAFFNCWTRKEAYLKAIGDGLSIPLDQFDVSLSPGEPARLYSIKQDRAAAERWCLQELTPAPNYVAALAVEGQDWNLTCWQWRFG